MNVPNDLLYTDQHEWIRVEGETAAVGITDFAQHALSDVTFVEAPAVGRQVARGEELGAIESCKAATSVYAPASGKVVDVNDAVADDPGLVNSDPYGQGWICKLALTDTGELSKLMPPEKYEAFCREPS